MKMNGKTSRINLMKTYNNSIEFMLAFGKHRTSLISNVIR